MFALADFLKILNSFKIIANSVLGYTSVSSEQHRISKLKSVIHMGTFNIIFPWGLAF